VGCILDEVYQPNYVKYACIYALYKLMTVFDWSCTLYNFEFFMCTSVACAVDSRFTQISFPSKTSLCNLIEFSMTKTTQNSISRTLEAFGEYQECTRIHL
jgi:hypothetical protein